MYVCNIHSDKVTTTLILGAFFFKFLNCFIYWVATINYYIFHTITIDGAPQVT